MPAVSPSDLDGPPDELRSDEAILEVARAKGVFTVSAHVRQADLLERCRRLKRAGRLIGGKPRGGCIVYFPAPGP